MAELWAQRDENWQRSEKESQHGGKYGHALVWNHQHGDRFIRFCNEYFVIMNVKRHELGTNRMLVSNYVQI